MKLFTPLLAFSLVANAALALAVFAHRPANPTPAAAANPAPAVAPADAHAPALNAGPLAGIAALARDDASYVARLRAAGFPPAIIRDLVFSRVWDRYRTQRAALQPAARDEYWRNGMFNYSSLAPELRAKLRELSKQATAEVRSLLGDGSESLDPMERRLHDQMAGVLTNDKVQQVQAIQRDYDDLAAQIRDRTKGMVLKADREALRLLERERRKDLEAALTPGELLEYDLRTGPTANNVRNRLANFEPTEQEFRALAKLQLDFDQRYGLTNLSGAEADRRHAAEKDLLAQIQAALPPERFTDYKVAIDGMFSETNHFVSAYNLAPAVAKQIVALKQSTWSQIDDLNRPGVTAEQRATTLAALQQQVDTQLTAQLGPAIYANYKNSGATWLNRLKPAPAASSRP